MGISGLFSEQKCSCDALSSIQWLNGLLHVCKQSGSMEASIEVTYHFVRHRSFIHQHGFSPRPLSIL